MRQGQRAVISPITTVVPWSKRCKNGRPWREIFDQTGLLVAEPASKMAYDNQLPDGSAPTGADGVASKRW